jgi:Ras-related protein Rab-11A
MLFLCTPQEDGKNIKMQVWDTAGQERYRYRASISRAMRMFPPSRGVWRGRAITKAYYRGALGALLVYDITCEESFKNVARWLGELKSHSNRDKEIVLIVVGNKKDVVDENPERRAVTEAMMQEMSEKLEVPVMEASAKTGENVEQAFISVTKTIYKGTHAPVHAAESSSRGAGAGSGVQASSKNDTINLDDQPAKKKEGCC